jgi:phage gp29-like protein
MADPLLYDATGTPIPFPGPANPPAWDLMPSGVENEVADRYRAYPSKHLSPNKITSVTEACDAGDPLEYVELLEEMREKDPKLDSVLHDRTAAVMGLPVDVTPVILPAEATQADVDLAATIAKFIDNVMDRAGLRGLLSDLMDALYKPFSISGIHWSAPDQGPVRPLAFSGIPARHVRWSFDSDEVRVYNPYGAVSNSRGNLGDPLPPYSTVRAIDLHRKDHPTRAGLGRTIVWYYYFKNLALKDWVSYGDRFGMPVRIIKLDPSDFRNPEMYQKARAAVKQMGVDASGVLSKNSDFEIVATSSRGGESLYQVIIDFFNTNYAQLVLGHELSSQSAPGQGQLGITAALQVRQDILEEDCEWLAGIVRRDVLTPMVGWNFGWDKLQFVPYLTFSYEPGKDLVATSTVLMNIAKAFPDFKFSEQQLRDEYNLDTPLGPEDEVTAGGGTTPPPAQFPSAVELPNVANWTGKIEQLIHELSSQVQLLSRHGS